jgi:hypothetical protein
LIRSASVLINRGEAMKPGFAVCPKCKGKGVVRYKACESRRVILSLLKLKTGRKRATDSMWLIEITCPGCDGTGRIDWISRSMRGTTLIRPFASLEGNMDLYYFRAVESWPRNCPTHKYSPVRTYYFKDRMDKIVELSQERYMGIKLNPGVLAMNPDELGDLYDSVIEYQGYLMALPKREITRNRIRAEITKRGLADFMPDKFAYPGPDDFPR